MWVPGRHAAAGGSREPAAEAERAEEGSVDIDTEAGCHDPIIDPGADHRAEPGALAPEPQDEREDEAESDDEKSIGRVELAPDAYAVGEEGGGGDRLLVIAPDHAHDIDADEDQSEGNEDLFHRALALDVSEQRGIDERAEPAGDQ